MAIDLISDSSQTESCDDSRLWIAVRLPREYLQNIDVFHRKVHLFKLWDTGNELISVLIFRPGQTLIHGTRVAHIAQDHSKLLGSDRRHPCVFEHSLSGPGFRSGEPLPLQWKIEMYASYLRTVPTKTAGFYKPLLFPEWVHKERCWFCQVFPWLS